MHTHRDGAHALILNGNCIPECDLPHMAITHKAVWRMNNIYKNLYPWISLSTWSAHLTPPLIATAKDPQFPGIHFLGSPLTKEVTSEGAVISWEGFGISFGIPPGAVPEDKEPLRLSVRPCLAGPFDPPDGYKFTSPVYLISPAFNFIKDIQLVIYHFADLQSDEDCEHMSFVSAPSFPQPAQSQSQYKFKRFKGGAFQKRQPFGTIHLRHFCLMANASNGKPHCTLHLHFQSVIL